MRSLKKRGPHVLDDLMTSYFPYIAIGLPNLCKLTSDVVYVRYTLKSESLGDNKSGCTLRPSLFVL